ncbi:MAG: DUF2092 domain-containing protein [Mobilicoccus sp.]|nr:DUF2092 domain-containing protein [Mobilicoccus sp.]
MSNGLAGSRRWAIPAVAALAIGGVGYGAVVATAGSGLPEKSAQEILTGMQHADVPALAGTVVAKADLGLPEIPGAAASAEFASLVSGSHTMRVWYDGPDKVRLAKLGEAGETNVIRNGVDAWIWSSADRTAVHHTLPADAPSHSATPRKTDMPHLPSTPEEAARQVVDTLDESATVSTTSQSRVAGRDAYELVITPDAQNTLVRDVRIAVDGETMMPLRVQINSTKLSAPAYEIGFTSLELGDVEDRMFTFTPPTGTTVEEAPADAAHTEKPDRAKPSTSTGKPEVSVVGEGWGRVYVMPMPSGGLDVFATGDQAPRGPHGGGEVGAGDVLNALPEVSGDWGTGRVLDGTLFSVVITDDAVAAGAVDAGTLTAALAESGR